jgi:DNA-binding PadR family transcriptional regulator
MPPRQTRSPEAELPLTPATFHILLALAGAERHGYGIMQEVATRTGGELRLGPGTLYGSLKRLVGDGLVEECEGRGDVEPEEERRRYYRLTAFGRAVASAEARRLEAMVRLARGARLLAPRST